MEAALLASISDSFEAVLHFLWQPIADTPWAFWRDGQWRDYWLATILDHRFLVSYFLLLLPLLLLFSRRHLRAGIILTGLAFLTYVFGALYPLFWLGMCLAFFWFGEKFALEAKRKDVLQWGPPLAAGFCIVGWYLLTQVFQHVGNPLVSDPIRELAPWLYPLGARGFSWEPLVGSLYPTPNHALAPPLLYAIFHDAHLIGTAYFAIRMLHYFSEIKRDGIPKHRRTLLNFLAYLCYAPNLMQGPIERFNEFQQEMDTCHQRRTWRNVPPAFARIGWGVLKCLLGMWYLSWFYHYIDPLDNIYYKHPCDIPDTGAGYALLYFGIYIQIYWLYLEFSGYCDISAGIAKLLGYRQIENFKWCWFATSLRDFWRRWHISLSFILRDYVYIALGGNRKRAVLNLMITFAVIGLWHATAFKFVVWGVVMGLMLVVNQWWINRMKRLDQNPQSPFARLRRAWCRLKPLPQVCSWALTMHCFVMSLLIFFGGSGAIRVGWELIRRPLGWLFGIDVDE